MEDKNLTPALESAALAISDMECSELLRLPHLYNALSLLHILLGPSSWVGLYLKRDKELVLGPFQGTPACEVIAFGKGVVGACFEKGQAIAVKDVHEFPGYICCDAAAASEICVPLWDGSNPIGVLDIDLPLIHEFSEKEIQLFEKIAADLQRFLK